MSDNWVVQNLQNALDTWNKYLSEIWQLNKNHSNCFNYYLGII